MHINYFGDTVLFTGWCLLTATWWTPYLEERYGDELIEYAKKTKKFMPFIY
jgi:protein-S-isoprenylcysteine O-methyltransferase Ste14